MSIPCAVCGEPSDTTVHPECRELWVEREVNAPQTMADWLAQCKAEGEDPFLDSGDDYERL